MDPLKISSPQAQDGLKEANPNQAVVENPDLLSSAVDVDDLFDNALADTQKINTKDVSISIDTDSATSAAAGRQVVEAKKAMSFDDLLQTDKAIQHLHVPTHLDVEEATVTLSNATNHGEADLKAALVAKHVFVVHGEDIGVHADIGWKEGQKITVSDQHGTRVLKVKILTSAQFSQLTKVVANFIAKLREEQKIDDKVFKAAARKHETRTPLSVAIAPRTHASRKKEKTGQVKTQGTREQRKINEIKIEKAIIELERVEIRKAQTINLVTTRQLIFKLVQDKKYEEGAMGFLHGLRNKEHSIHQILRQLLIKFRGH